MMRRLSWARLPKPIPGSTMIISGAMPAPRAAAIEGWSSRRISLIVFLYETCFCIVLGVPRMCISTTGTFRWATRRASSSLRFSPEMSLMMSAPASRALSAISLRRVSTEIMMSDSLPDGLHHGDDPADLLLRLDGVGARARGLAAHVDDVHPRGDHLAGALHRLAQRLVPARGVEGIGRAVEDAHDVGLAREVEDSAPPRHHPRARGKAGGDLAGDAVETEGLAAKPRGQQRQRAPASRDDEIGLAHGELVRLLLHCQPAAQGLDAALHQVGRPRVHAFQLDRDVQELVGDLLDVRVGDVDLAEVALQVDG